MLTLLLVIVLVVGGTVGLFGVAAIATVGALSTDLPDPSGLRSMTFSQPTVVYDRSGEVELARFQREQRRVVTFDEVPRLILDATTTAEDRTFWENDGYDPGAILSAMAENASGQSERGASTITQQLVRARLLPDEYTRPGADRYLRKAKEIIQSARLTEAFPGEGGKEQIVTAYLNEIFYGHDAYGVAAAARIYFGVTDLAELTPAQAALLAALPKSPTTLDPYRFAKPDEDGRLVVPSSAPPVVRRDWILDNLATSRWTRLSESQLKQALAEPVVLAGDQPLRFRAAHFTWQVRRQLESILGGPDVVDTGGYRVITTLDWKAQSLAERWLAAAAIAPNLSKKEANALLDAYEIPDGDRGWIRALRGKDIHNAALVALNYKNGDVLAYTGSAGYYRDDIASPKFEPKYDAAGDGARQPGSAFKPIVYATAFEQRALTPGSLLLDITTEFNRRARWAPRDADQLERGPVLVRRALQFSLNIPAIRALERVGNEAVADQAERLGIRFAGGKTAFLQAGLSAAIGTVEVRPLDLTAAYGALGNGGQRPPPRMILEIRGPDGRLVWQAPELRVEAALSPHAAFLVTDILAGNTDRRQNPIWAPKLEVRNGPGGSRRPAAVKTGTANDARDLATYGYLAPPEDDQHPGLAVGIWMGNSDHSNPRTRKPATSITAAAPLWRAFVRDYSRGWPVTDFNKPGKIVVASIDAWSGGRPGPWTRDRIREYFLAGTQPGTRSAVDPAGLLYSPACGGWRVDPVKAELGPAEWRADVRDWAERARRGPGVRGRYDSRTAYFWGERSWGGQIVGPCPKPKPPKDDHGKEEKPPRDGGDEGPPDPTPPPDGGGG
ncbi:MAG TPA: transglycosylase domain-containing protein [Candidatus Limnocylindrales bacterium]|nr:transglycosylase domain-containing protein [Candidatus Limnocylindrales bacterium]